MIRSVLFFAVLLSGCAHTSHFDAGTVEGRAAVNDRAKGQRTTVELRDGQRLSVEGLSVGSDSTSWVVPETGRAYVIATDSIGSISFPAGGDRIGEGLGIGFFAGAAVGYVVGYSTYREPSFVISDRGSSAVGGTLLFAGLGALAGALIGSDSENEDVFIPSSDGGANE